MFDLASVMDIAPYSLNKEQKSEFLTLALLDLTRHHYEECIQYKKMMDARCFNVNDIKSYLDIPFLPVRLFKELELLSMDKSEVVKIMTSSGTSGQSVSKIFLDKQTSSNQQKVLVKIVSSLLGSKRLPMIILDSSAVIKDRTMFSARGAGILGFSIFGNDRLYALDQNMELAVDDIMAFLEKHSGENMLMFGFTFMIWQHFYKGLVKTGYRPDLSKAILLHGGGWKKLSGESVSPSEFKKCLNDVCQITRVHDYYGMVEQTGSIYVECEEGHLHAPIFSDIIMRRYKDFSVCDFGEKGIIEVVSVLPGSYPGHALLTEDEGVILGEDDCSCGRLGKYFRILGRLKNAELRGCSDTYAVNF